MLHSYMQSKHKWLLSLAAALLMLVLICPGMAEENAALSFRQMAKPSQGTVTIFDAISKQKSAVAQVAKGEQCEVIGTADNYYRVLYNGQTGYALKSKLTVEAVQASVPEALCDTVKLKTPIPNRHETNLYIEGTITAEKPIKTLFIYIWDERQQRIEHVYTKDFPSPSNKIDTKQLEKSLPLSRYTGGRKTLILEGNMDGETVVLFRSPFYVIGSLQEPVHITNKCRNLPVSVTDEKVSTAWVPKKSEPSLVVKLPENAQPALLNLEWKTLPDSVTVELRDATGETLETIVKQTGFYMDSIPLNSQVQSAVVTPTGSEAALANLRVYAEGYPTLDVQNWEPLPDKIDILLLSTHQDDEFLFFGGSIPYYAAREDATIGVLYMADCGRHRYREALNGLWSAGLRHHPIFFGLLDDFTMSIDEAAAMWRNDDLGTKLVRLIRQYKPDVILAQDFNGEYGHGQHKYATRTAADYFQLAADASFDPESAEKYGTWQVKKFYVHLYEENQIVMDWDVPLDETGVITPMFLAWEGYDKNKSQLASFSMERDGVMYDNTLFGLYYTSVGPDIEKNDFLENLR